MFRSLENLMTFPFVRNSVERGDMSLHGAYFGVAEGSLFVLDAEAKEFHSVSDKIALIGANGKGKSTLLRMIAGVEPFEGENLPGYNVLPAFFRQSSKDSSAVSEA